MKFDISSIVSSVPFLRNLIPAQFRFILDLVSLAAESVPVFEEIITGPGKGPRKGALLKRRLRPLLDEHLDAVPGFRDLPEEVRDDLIEGVIQIPVFALQVSTHGADPGPKRREAFAQGVSKLVRAVVAIIARVTSNEAEVEPDTDLHLYAMGFHGKNLVFDGLDLAE